MKNILGLDLGTNSIGWALVKTDDNGIYQQDIKLGSRIIPMGQDVLDNFNGGKPIESAAATRTRYRGMRRLNERRSLRRERLLRVLHILGFLPPHYDNAIGWDRNNGKTFGKFKSPEAEPKLAWKKNEQGKYEFLFMQSFEEMLKEFREKQPELIANNKKIPYDWTLYYLRKKALSEQISKEELAWILLNFNQKRGYYQLRGKDDEISQEEDKTKRVEYIEQLVVSVEADKEEKPSPKGVWYNVHLENGMTYRRQSKTSLADWTGKMREFIVTTELNDDGTEKKDKDGLIKRSFRSPGPDDWSLKKVRSESNLEKSGLTTGAYIYQHLLEDPSGKIIGKFVQTIDRHFYKEELYAIIRKQMQYHKVLNDATMIEACSKELYARNEAHQTNLNEHDMSYLLVEDVLFYQRPLKSKKSLIEDCSYESHKYVDTETGEEKIVGIKCIAKSNPYFQEFRLRQFIMNLALYDTTGIQDTNVTEHYLPDTKARESLYQWMSQRAEISEETLLKEYFGIKKPKGKDTKYPIRWNYVQDKKYPAGETRSLLLKGLAKAETDSKLIDNPETEYRLWHLLYSVDDVNELKGALAKYADFFAIENRELFVDSFASIKPFAKEYGSYSEKAIKKMLPLLREGKPLHEICYELYGRYSEGSDAQKWNSPDELHSFICGFKQYSLRNPIVEQCILETLRTVEAIWRECGHIDEIHIELGREMKNPADKRKHISEQNQKNENTNLRIKALLLELLNDPAIDDVRPNSPMQQDILRIYEEGALLNLSASDPDYKEILSISQMAQPSASQLSRYKLWLEQKYRSPYTGRMIPLGKLFTPAYQIEHVIPKARYFDDSFSNKVICEAEVNKLKDKLLAHEFICKLGGQVVQTNSGPVTIFNKEEYEEFVKQHYASHKGKLQKLMLNDIPEEFIQRQLNDSRYISKVIKSLLSNIVREEGDEQDMSPNVIVCTGGVTDRLKRDWGMNDVWNHIVYPRYERLNKLTESELFGHWENKDGKRYFQTSMPSALQKGYSKKRIDHRHHAMDALVIACASRNIVNYLSNQNAHDGVMREDLKRKLSGKGGTINKPWNSFTHDAELALSQIVISFKNNVRVLNSATNVYEKYGEDGKKQRVHQEGKQLVVRKPLHKETVFGHVNLRRKKEVTIDTALLDVKNIVDGSLRNRIVDLFSEGKDKKQIKKILKEEGVSSKVEIFYFTDDDDPMVAVRKALDDSFDVKKIMSITDTGIQKILLSYLSYKNNDPKTAFSPEGIVELNENIAEFNNGKPHQPIRAVRVSEPMGEKYRIGYSVNKAQKFVEAQGGTNLYFAIYERGDGSRTYATIPLYLAVERKKQGLSPAPEKDEDGNRLLFTLSPNDLVYVPSEEEINSMFIPDVQDLNLDRIYRFVSATKKSSYYVPHRLATPLLSIKKGIEIEGTTSSIVHEISLNNSLGKIEVGPFGKTIKSICWKLEVDRLGQITKIIR